MKQIIYMGSRTDGYEYWQEVGETTTGGQTFRRKIGDFYLKPVKFTHLKTASLLSEAFSIKK